MPVHSLVVVALPPMIREVGTSESAAATTGTAVNIAPAMPITDAAATALRLNDIRWPFVLFEALTREYGPDPTSRLDAHNSLSLLRIVHQIFGHGNRQIPTL